MHTHQLLHICECVMSHWRRTPENTQAHIHAHIRALSLARSLAVPHTHTLCLTPTPRTQFAMAKVAKYVTHRSRALLHTLIPKNILAKMAAMRYEKEISSLSCAPNKQSAIKDREKKDKTDKERERQKGRTEKVEGGEREGVGREEGGREVFFCTEIPEGTIMFCCLKSRRGVDGGGGPRKSMYTKYYFDRRRKEVIRGGGMVENFGLETPFEHTIDRHGNRPPQRVEGQRAHPFFQVVH